MNVIHFSTYDRGGAGNAAYFFHKSLQKKGVNSRMLVLFKKKHDDSVIQVKVNKLVILFYQYITILQDKAGIFKKKYDFHDRMLYAVNSTRKIKKYIYEKPDVIVLSWISRFINLKLVLELQKKYNSKIFWIFTDMAPMTGGCHFSWDCEGYKYHCSICPAVIYPYLKLPIHNLQNKLEIINQLDITALILGPWFEQILSESKLFRNKKKMNLHISGVTDENIFYIKDKKKIKKLFGISSEKRVILYGAYQTKSYRKGYEYFVESIGQYSMTYDMSKISIITIGDQSIEFNIPDQEFEYRHLGIIPSQKELANAYNLADVIVSPVLEDMGPAVLVQAMLCGIPAVAFNVAIVKDIIGHKISGYIAKGKSSSDIVAGINYILNLSSTEYAKMQINARDSVLSIYSENIAQKQLQNFIKSIKSTIH